MDLTLGGGGHTRGIFERIESEGVLIGCDQDVESLDFCRNALPSSVHLIQCRFSEVASRLTPLLPEGVTGVLMDLGVSSHQLDDPARGFSHRHSGPLDLRMNQVSGETATDLLGRLGESELVGIIRDYGEDSQARRIARAIVQRRAQAPITTTDQLAEVIAKAVPATRVKSLSRVFQALRIAVNHEMDELDAGLRAAWELLRPTGRLVVISYHSLEDRRVKQFMKEKCEIPDDHRLPIPHPDQQLRAKLIVRKPITPDTIEIAINPRARSAKLRCIEKIR